MRRDKKEEIREEIIEKIKEIKDLRNLIKIYNYIKTKE